jgi:hypothetical protein
MGIPYAFPGIYFYTGNDSECAKLAQTRQKGLFRQVFTALSLRVRLRRERSGGETMIALQAISLRLRQTD